MYYPALSQYFQALQDLLAFLSDADIVVAARKTVGYVWVNLRGVPDTSFFLMHLRTGHHYLEAAFMQARRACSDRRKI